MTHEQSPRESGRARMESPDLSEKGGLKGGQPQRSDERLFMQLLAFSGCTDAAAAGAHLAAASVPGVLYEDLNDPQGIALLTVVGDARSLRRRRAAGLHERRVRRATR